MSSSHNVWRYWDDYRKERPSESFDQYVAQRAQAESDERKAIRVRGIVFRDEDDAHDHFVQREVDRA